MNVLQAIANPPREFLRKVILMKLQTAPGILSYIGKVGAKRDILSLQRRLGVIKI